MCSRHILTQVAKLYIINVLCSSVIKRQGDEVGKGQSKLEKGEEIIPR
jgi:hypothetical protein